MCWLLREGDAFMSDEGVMSTDQEEKLRLASQSLIKGH